MTQVRTVIIYLLFVFVGGALVAPWFYWAVQSMSGLLPALASSPFHRFVNRSMLGLALIGLWPVLKRLGATSIRDLGLVRPDREWKSFGGGCLTGLASLAVVAALCLSFGARYLRDGMTPSRIGNHLFGAMVAAIAIALIEELLFRGAMFGYLRRVVQWIVALAVSSMVYALVHFMERATLEGDVTWLSGLVLLPKMLGGFTQGKAVIPMFCNLTVAGMLLGLAYQRTGNLYFSIGLHFGWIVCLKSYAYFSRPIKEANMDWWGTSRMIDGWAAFPILMLTLLVFTQLPIGKKKVPDERDD